MTLTDAVNCVWKIIIVSATSYNFIRRTIEREKNDSMRIPLLSFTFTASCSWFPLFQTSRQTTRRRYWYFIYTNWNLFSRCVSVWCVFRFFWLWRQYCVRLQHESTSTHHIYSHSHKTWTAEGHETFKPQRMRGKKRALASNRMLNVARKIAAFTTQKEGCQKI